MITIQDVQGQIHRLGQAVGRRAHFAWHRKNDDLTIAERGSERLVPGPGQILQQRLVKVSRRRRRHLFPDHHHPDGHPQFGQAVQPVFAHGKQGVPLVGAKEHDVTPLDAQTLHQRSIPATDGSTIRQQAVERQMVGQAGIARRRQHQTGHRRHRQGGERRPPGHQTGNPHADPPW